MAWDYFTDAEMACRHCGRLEMDEAFMERLGRLRAFLRFSMPVSSGFRCPYYNNEVSSTGREGPHTTGKAADILISGAMASILLREAMAFGFTGIGLRQSGPTDKRFIHLDTMPRPYQTIWTY